MINLRTLLIMEANQKRPSGLGKIKDNSREEEVEFIAGDIYDLSDTNRYTDKFKYYRGDGNGYIMDKDGNVYDVETSSQQGDAGRIAGGSTDRYVTIKNINGINIHFHGWSGIFSRSYGMGIIADIEAGMYLEDYIAKNWDVLDSKSKENEEIIKLKEEGNPEAKTYKEQKEESKAERIAKFWERYIMLHTLAVSVKDGNVEIETNDIRSNYERFKNRKPEIEWDKDNNRTQESETRRKEWEDGFNKYQSIIIDTLKPVVADLFSKKFGSTLSDMNGLKFNMDVKYSHRTPMVRLGFDTKKKVFVELEYNNAKIRSEKYWPGEHAELDMGPTVTLVKDDATQNMIDIFMNASKEYKKLNKGKRREWIDANWEKIYAAGNTRDWLYGPQSMTKGEAKAKAASDFKQDLLDHDWNTSGKTITFMTEFISQFMTNPEKIEQVTGEEVETAPENTSRRGANTVMGKGARSKQEAKMDAWHKGERKQNVANCSDAKLKMNYDICKEKGYEKEAATLKAEATKRGLTLESLQEYINNF